MKKLPKTIEFVKLIQKNRVSDFFPNLWNTGLEDALPKDEERNMLQINSLQLAVFADAQLVRAANSALTHVGIDCPSLCDFEAVAYRALGLGRQMGLADHYSTIMLIVLEWISGEDPAVTNRLYDLLNRIDAPPDQIIRAFLGALDVNIYNVNK